MRNVLLAIVPIVLLCAAERAAAAEEIRLWHGMSGALGTELDRLVTKYNASQKQYRVVSFFQGPYDEVMADDIALRKGTRRAPHLVQVNESGTADMLKSGSARPLWELLRAGRQISSRGVRPSFRSGGTASRATLYRRDAGALLQP